MVQHRRGPIHVRLGPQETYVLSPETYRCSSEGSVLPRTYEQHLSLTQSVGKLLARHWICMRQLMVHNNGDPVVHSRIPKPRPGRAVVRLASAPTGSVRRPRFRLPVTTFSNGRQLRIGGGTRVLSWLVYRARGMRR